MLLHDGQIIPFDIAPFLDGSMPNAPPVSFLNIILTPVTYTYLYWKHNLPPLTSAATIAGLNPGQLNAYCNGYVGVGHGLVGAARQIAIARAIGCTVAP
jgi:hypothetical protein